MAADLKQKEVAYVLGFRDASKIAQWEQGRYLPTLTNAFRLAACYGVMVEAIYLDHYRSMKIELMPKLDEILRRKEIEKHTIRAP